MQIRVQNKRKSVRKSRYVGDVSMTKGIAYVVIMVRLIKIFIEYVGNNTSI